MDADLLGVATAGEERHDALAGAEAAGLGADLCNLAGALEAQDRRGARRRGVHALALQQVGAVHRGGAHPDAHVGGLERGSGRVAQGEDGFVAGLAHEDGTHGASAHHGASGLSTGYMFRPW